MAITSVGYDGTVDEKQFEAIMGYSAHSQYGVNTPGAFAASSVAGQVLQVRITAGNAWTGGVVDFMDAAETVQLSAVTSGSRWDMIVLRRDYQPPGGTTSLAVVKGGSAMVLPARQNNPGVLDDQPLWLVKVESRSGQSVIAQYVDLRVWARNGGCTANHDLVRSYLSNTGTMVEINGTLWLRRVGANGQNEWVKPVEIFTKEYVDFHIQDHGHRTLHDPLTGQRLYMDRDGNGNFLLSTSVRGRTYASAPNMYVSENGVIGRATGHSDQLQNGKHSFYLLGGGSVRCDGVYANTANIQPNMFVSSGGTFGRSTANSSLREYKTNIRPADLDPADVLALEPVIYDRKDGSGENELGLIAEDTQHAIPNLTFDEDGRLEGVRYDRIAVALLSVVKVQQEQIEGLTARLNKLEGN